MTLLHLALVVVIFVLVVIGIRYFGPRFKNPSPGPPPGPAPRELYVADEGDTAIWVFGIDDFNSTLQVPPVRNIIGGALGDVGQTQLRYPIDISVDGGGTVFVLNQILDRDGSPLPQVSPVLIFPAGRGGNIAPFAAWDQTVFGANVPGCLAVSSNPNSLLLGVASGGPSVEQLDKFPQQPNNHALPGSFALDAGFITGIASKGPSFALVLTTQPENQPQYSVLFFAFTPDFGNGAANPSQTITGPKSLLNRPQRITFGPDGSMYVTNWGDGEGSGSVTVYTPDANGNFQLAHRIGGPGSINSRLSQPTGIAVGDDGTIYVADVSQIKVFPANSDGDVAPSQTVNMNTDIGMPLGAEITGLAFHIPKQ